MKDIFIYIEQSQIGLLDYKDLLDTSQKYTELGKINLSKTDLANMLKMEYNKDLMKSISMDMFNNDSYNNSFGFSFNDFEDEGIQITLYGNGKNKETEREIRDFIQ